jgi:hypothetical protein
MSNKIYVRHSNRQIIAISRDADKKLKNDVKTERHAVDDRDRNYIIDIIPNNIVKPLKTKVL